MLEIIVRPLILMILLAFAAILARILKPLFPEGRLKQILYRKRQVIPTEERETY